MSSIDWSEKLERQIEAGDAGDITADAILELIGEFQHYYWQCKRKAEAIELACELLSSEGRTDLAELVRKKGA